MTKKETAAVLAKIRAMYPNSLKNMDKQAFIEAVDIWAGIFSNADYAAVNRAVEEFIAEDEKGFPPSVGQIRAKLRTREATAIHKDWSWMKPHIDKCRANRIAKYGSEAAWETHRREMGWTD